MKPSFIEYAKGQGMDGSDSFRLLAANMIAAAFVQHPGRNKVSFVSTKGRKKYRITVERTDVQ